MRWLVLLVCPLLLAGCSSSPAPEQSGGSDETLALQSPVRGGGVATDRADMVQGTFPTLRSAGGYAGENDLHLTDLMPQTSNLLDACLPPEQLTEGWVRLFDNQSQLGWFYTGSANWDFNKGVITVDAGEPSFLCTNFQISDYELLVDFKCPTRTNSGIFLRTTADPRDVTRECYELNIAPPDNPFPTGSLVQRHRVEPAEIGELEPNAWHTYRVIVQGDQVKVWLNDKEILQYTDPGKLRTGYIGLQHREGSVSFRNILLRPLSAQPLSTGQDWQEHWTRLDGEQSSFTVESVDNWLHLQGGPAQLESKLVWQDSVIQAVYKTADPLVESGIHFRGLSGMLGQGYTMAIYHGDYTQKNPKLQSGSLAIPQNNRIANARVLVGDGSQPTYVTIIADQGQFSTFINGLMVDDVADTRELNTNPRQGCRLEAGPIALEGATPATDIWFSNVRVSRIEH